MQVAAAAAVGVEVYHLGYHSRHSYGAASWLLRDRAAGVNVMVDSPRFSSKLAAKLQV